MTNRTEQNASRKGRVLLMTGDGKGKTTGAMGLVLRALGHGWRVCILQFLKAETRPSGERQVLKELGVECYAAGRGFVHDKAHASLHAKAAREAWSLATEKLACGVYDLVVLDEITYPVAFGWITVQEISEAVRRAADQQTTVVLTGRNAPQELAELADTVSEMRLVKHGYDAGIAAMPGIEF